MAPARTPARPLPLRRQPNQARSRDKVARALAAADDLLDEAGPDALTLNRVAERAGLTAGALHQYLPDRDAIVEVLAARYHERLEALMVDAMARPADPQADDPIGTTLAAVAEVYRDTAALRSLRLGHQGTSSRAHKQRMAAHLARALAARGLVDGATAERVAPVIFFAADGVVQEAFRREPGGDPDLLEELGSMLRAYLSR